MKFFVVPLLIVLTTNLHGNPKPDKSTSEAIAKFISYGKKDRKKYSRVILGRLAFENNIKRDKRKNEEIELDNTYSLLRLIQRQHFDFMNSRRVNKILKKTLRYTLNKDARAYAVALRNIYYKFSSKEAKNIFFEVVNNPKAEEVYKVYAIEHLVRLMVEDGVLGLEKGIESGLESVVSHEALYFMYSKYKFNSAKYRKKIVKIMKDDKDEFKYFYFGYVNLVEGKFALASQHLRYVLNVYDNRETEGKLDLHIALLYSTSLILTKRYQEADKVIEKFKLRAHKVGFPFSFFIDFVSCFSSLKQRKSSKLKDCEQFTTYSKFKIVNQNMKNHIRFVEAYMKGGRHLSRFVREVDTKFKKTSIFRTIVVN